MNAKSVNDFYVDNQLILLGIELVHKVFGLLDCNPELLSNSHAKKALDIAREWNERFYDSIVLTKEGK